jgi:S-adenosyl-L-methionine hydrolase (adenosine-forming)
MTVITLTTDFGSADHEAGVLKGVIWKIAPEVKIADLSHDISRHNVPEAALLLWRAAPFFPNETIHVVVVDPGVGTIRRGIAARFGSQYFVGPDNGLLSMLLSQAEELNQPTSFIFLDRPEYWLPEISNVFHGRDVFAPVAAHLALGVPMNLIGTTIDNPIRLEFPKPVPIKNGWRGQVIHIDHFGNLSTNINARHLLTPQEVKISIKGKQINGMVSTYGERPIGALIALLDSNGSLSISVVDDSAEKFLGAHVGDDLKVEITR